MSGPASEDLLAGADEICTHRRQQLGLLSDLAVEDTVAVLSYDAGQHCLVQRTGDDLARAAARLAGEVLHHEAARDEHALLDVHAEEGEVDREDCDWCFDDGWDGWANLHAALLVPAVTGGLAGVVSPADHDVLEQASGEVAEPAASVLRLALDRCRPAA